MHKHDFPHPTLSLTDTINTSPENTHQTVLWEEYSSFHDAFAQQLAYESSRKSRFDIWLLNYI